MRLLFSILSVLSFLHFRAQTGLSNGLKIKLAEKDSHSNTFDVLIKADPLKLRPYLKDIRVKYSVDKLHSISCPASVLLKLAEDKVISYAELSPGRLQVLNDTMMIRNRVAPVRNGESPLMQAYDGTGMVIGFIDTGIDFNHPDLKDPQGKTRVRYLWDQVQNTGPAAPAPFSYGVEWTSAQIDSGLCTHSDAPNFGHGTHVAGVAAGNANGNGKHMGVASGADIIMVAVDLNKQGPTVADAVQYIISRAALLGKPCVINASVGDYYGSHDATDLEAQMISAQVSNKQGVIMVAAAGNAGSSRFHVRTQPAGDTTFTWLRRNALTLEYWCYADTTQIKNIEIAVGANRSNFTDIGRTGFRPYNDAISSVQYDTLHNSAGNRMGVIQSAASINTEGVYELYLKITADTINLYWRIESKGTGRHDSWNFDFVSSNLPATGSYPFISKYTMPDTLLTMVSGFQNSDEVVTVANYNNLRNYYDVNNTYQDNGLVAGEINPGSSLGPTRDGRQKPDIAATGHFVFSTTVLTMLPNLIANAPQVVSQGSLHVRGGGTSVASPVVAGVAALYLQKNPYATNQMFRNAVITCAYQDAFTGTSLPDHKWGYGKIDAKNTLLCHDNLVGMYANSKQNADLFPNPFSETLHIKFQESFSNGVITGYSADGKKIFSTAFSGDSFDLNSESFKNYSGLILLKVDSENYSRTFKVIKEQ